MRGTRSISASWRVSLKARGRAAKPDIIYLREVLFHVAGGGLRMSQLVFFFFFFWWWAR